ncbi:MAG: hypothetical protein QXG98_05750 [Candidatus Micrarchaeia archaeon]
MQGGLEETPGSPDSERVATDEERQARNPLFALAILAGLSLLLLALLGGVVYYLSFYPAGQQDSCVIETSIQCVSWRLSTAGELKLKLANGYASGIFIDGAACSSDPMFDGSNAALKRLGVFVRSGDAAELSITCTGPNGAASAGLPGEGFDGKLFIEYHLEGEPVGSRGVLGSLRTRRA